MEKKRKNLFYRVIFWGIILAAPAAFLIMVSVYLNAYVTGERVNFVMIPVFEVISGRTVDIGYTDARVGITSSLDFRDIRFLPGDGADNESDAAIKRFYVQFKPLTIFTRVFHVDSVVVDGLQGTIAYDPERSFSHFDWADDDQTRRMEVNINQSDLENIHIKCLQIGNSDFRYVHRGLDLEYLIDEFSAKIEIQGIRVMNVLLINGSIGGALMDSGLDTPHTSFSISGRLQINLDDKFFILRQGRLEIDGEAFPFMASLVRDGETEQLSLFFEHSPDAVSASLQKLPDSIIKWLHGDLPGSRYRVIINYAGDHATDQT